MDLDESKDELAKTMRAIIESPLVWKSPAVCKIQDLHEDRYEDALRLIKHHYFREEPMCKATFLLRDQQSVKGYLDLIKTWIRDTTSIIALSTMSDRVIGVAVTRINNFSDMHDTYNRIPDGESLKKIMDLQNHLIEKSNAYELFQRDEYFRVHILCVHPSYDYKEIGSALLNACEEVAISLKLSALGGIFGSADSQSTAESTGFRRFVEILYNRWTVNDQIIFDDVGRGNYSVTFMGRQISQKEDDDLPLMKPRP